MENTRTDYAVMGEIVRESSTSFWDDKQKRLCGTFLSLLFRRETGIFRKEKLVFRNEKLVSRKELL